MPASLDLDKRLLTSLMIMGSVVEARDAYTGGHLWRVGQFSRLLAEKAGLDRREVFLAGLGGFMHDLGKVGVPDAVLNKAGALTECPMCGPIIATHGLADGHRHGCRSCGGLLRLHRHGDDWEAEATMEMAPPEMLAPVADLAPIKDLIALAP